LYAIYDPVTGTAYLPKHLDTLNMPALPPHLRLAIMNWYEPAAGAAVVIQPGQTARMVEEPSGASVRYYSGVFGPYDPLYMGSSTSGSLTMATVVESAANTFNLIALKKVRDLLAGYEVYAGRNWDSYDAEPITAETLAAARRFIRMLPTSLGDPAIAPGADGTIALEWIFKSRPLRKLFIDIGPGNLWSGYWRMNDGRKGTIRPSTIDPTTEAELADLFKKLQ
jgi:hypothetical protein